MLNKKSDKENVSILSKILGIYVKVTLSTTPRFNENKLSRSKVSEYNILKSDFLLYVIGSHLCTLRNFMGSLNSFPDLVDSRMVQKMVVQILSKNPNLNHRTSKQKLLSFFVWILRPEINTLAKFWFSARVQCVKSIMIGSNTKTFQIKRPFRERKIVISIS